MAYSAENLKKMLAGGLTQAEVNQLQMGTASQALKIKAGKALSAGMPTAYNDWEQQAKNQASAPHYDPATRTSTAPVVPASNGGTGPSARRSGGGGTFPLPTSSIPQAPVAQTNPYPPMPSMTDLGAMPQIPGPYQFSVPTLEMHDFTEKAKQLAADAFAPYLAAFDVARTNAQAQGKTSKEATAGLYSNFVKDIAAKAAETADRYDEVKAEQAQRTTQQQSDVQENQQSANANLGDQLKAYGLEQSIPSTLGQGVAQQTNAQNVAGQAGESQQQFYDTEKLAQGNYDTRFGELAQKSGIGAQGDLDSQLMNILAGIDINKANAQGEQSTTALDLAQKLADRDFQMQSQNAGLNMQGQQLNAGSLQDYFKNQMGQRQQIGTENQDAFNNWMSTNDWISKQAGAAGSTFDLGDLPPGASRALSILDQGTGSKQIADSAYQAMVQRWREFKANPALATSTTGGADLIQMFTQEMGDLAESLGVPASIMEAAAAEHARNAELL